MNVKMKVTYALDDAQTRLGVLMLERQLGDLMELQRAVSVASEASYEAASLPTT